MATLLQIHSSILGDNSQSSALARQFTRQWQTQHPDGRVISRDLAADPLPHLDGTRVGAFFTDAAQRSPEQQALVAQSDALIEELRQADVVVLGVPMYNFSIPSQLKSWMDNIARAGVSFRYTSNGPEGLLGNKPVYIFTTRGGIYHANDADYQVPFLRQFFGLLGMTDIQVIYAEGLNTDGRDAALEDARRQVDALAAKRSDAA